MLERIVEWIVQTVHEWGYGGIVIMMAVESTILPFPSEVALIPAGYLAAQGKMDPVLADAGGRGREPARREHQLHRLHDPGPGRSWSGSAATS